MIGDVSSLNAQMEFSELRDHVPQGQIRVLMGIIHEDRPHVSLFGDFPDGDTARDEVMKSGVKGALYHGYDDKREPVLEMDL